MKFLRRIQVPLIGIVVLGFALWLFWPQIRFRIALSQIADRMDPNVAPTPKGFYLNTYSDRVSSADIGALYHTGCQRLDKIRGALPRKTYQYEDAEGYLGVASVVQYPNGFVYVEVFGGNDADSVSIKAAPGRFPLSEDSNNRDLQLKELPSDQLPSGVIRPW